MSNYRDQGNSSCTRNLLPSVNTLDGYEFIWPGYNYTIALTGDMFSGFDAGSSGNYYLQLLAKHLPEITNYNTNILTTCTNQTVSIK